MRSIILVALVLALAGCNGAPSNPTPTPATLTPATPILATPTPTEATPTVAATPTPTPTTPPPVLDSSSFTLAASGIPAQAKPGAAFNFTLTANGSLTRASDHIGAHYAGNDTTNPPTAPGRKDCAHQTGELPGTFVVNCTIADTGAWFVWGHARINDSNGLHDWWTPTPTAVKVRDYVLNASGFPTNPPTGGSNFTFILNISGVGASDNASSDHVGAHFWNASEPNPTVANAAGSCVHTTTTGVINSFTVTCSIPQSSAPSRDFYVRGHMRISTGNTTLDWWSPEQKVSVAIGVTSTCTLGIGC